MLELSTNVYIYVCACVHSGFKEILLSQSMTSAGIPKLLCNSCNDLVLKI